VSHPAVQRRYLLLVLLLVYVLHHIDRNILLLVLEPIRREFALSDTELGALAGIAYALPFAVAGIPLGALADRWTRTRLLAAFILAWSAFTALAGCARTFLVLLVTRAA
jgi:MFS family permease